MLVDINWRPVFWEDESSALAAIKPYACKADIVKMSDEEAEWMFGIPAKDALDHPLKASISLHFRLHHCCKACACAVDMDICVLGARFIRSMMGERHRMDAAVL